MEAHQEMQDKVAMGLIPPPKPKIKLSNMMRALTNKSVAAPSAMTKEVLEGIEERKKDHEMRNLAAKKTPAEKWAKKKEKILEDSKGPIVVALFKVENMCEPPSRAASLRFKLDVNAQKMDMSGCALCVREPLERLPDGTRKTCNLIIFEGGEKRIKKLEKLMKRIKWNAVPAARPAPTVETTEGEDITQGDGDAMDVDDGYVPPNSYKMVWKGYAAKPAYSRFFVEDFQDAMEAKTSLEKLGIGHYWDLAANA